MDLGIAALILFAAFLHAAWNGLLRGGADRLWSMTGISIAMFAIAVMALPFVALPARASWLYLTASGLVHIGYNLSLVRNYRSGDLGATYPIARGTSPMLIALGAAFFASEHLTLLALAGVSLISFGIIALALQGQRMRPENLGAALTTGIFIAIYTIIDGIGVRLAGDAIAYTAYMSLFFVLMPVYFWMARGAAAFTAPLKAWISALTAGLLCMLAYGIVIFAMQRSPMGIVSALRETSVVFAALIGWFFLNETLTWRRMAACCVIALGAAGLGLGHEFNA